MDEFDVIRYFARRQGGYSKDVVIGIGDDGAVCRPNAGRELVVATDTLVAGTHFLANLPAEAIAHRALAVNLSDLAAMGASPRWCLLNLSLPRAEPEWLASFANGFFTLAESFGLELVGGDTVRGELAVTVTVLGELPPGQALRRDGASPGDLIFVTGELGSAGHAWRALETPTPPSFNDPLMQHFLYPAPRVDQGIALGEVATAAIDISDGLLVDLGRLLTASGLGAEINVNALPMANDLIAECGLALSRDLALSGGDDYELCFTLPAVKKQSVIDMAENWDCDLSCIGRCTAGTTIDWILDGASWSPAVQVFTHF